MAARIHWLLTDGSDDKAVQFDVFKSPQLKSASSSSTRLSLALPAGLIQRLAQLCLEQGEDSLICLSRATDSRSPLLLLLDRKNVKTTDKRLCSGPCAAPRPNLHAVLSPALLKRLQCSEQRATVRGGVATFRTLFACIKIGVWNLGPSATSMTVPRGVPLKIEWQMRGLETFGAPPGVTQASSECLVGASSAIVQLLEAGPHGIMLLSAGGAGPMVAVTVSQAVRSTDKRLLINSCAATDAERHCWLSAALRQALHLEKKEERRNVPAFKTLYSPVSIGFMVPAERDESSADMLRGSSGSNGSSSGSNSSNGSVVVSEFFEFGTGGSRSSSAQASPFKPVGSGQRQSVSTISPEAISKILAGKAESQSRCYKSSALAHELCAAAKAILAQLEAAPRRLAVTRYLLRAPPLSADAGLWDEALSAGAPRHVEPHQAPPASLEDESVLCPSPLLDPPPPSPFSVSSSIFSPTAPAQSAAEARKSDPTRPYYGCVFGTPAPGASPRKDKEKEKDKEEEEKEEEDAPPPASPAIRSSIRSAIRTPGDVPGRRRDALTTPLSSRDSPASKSTPRLGKFATGNESPDQFTATKVARSEQNLPRYYVDAPGLVRELIARALERREERGGASKAAAGPTSPVALHASILAHHSRDIDPLTLTTSAQFFAFFSSLPSLSEAKALLLAAAPALPAYTWVRVLEPRELRPGDCVAVQERQGASGHVWIVLDIHLDPRTQLVNACTIIESAPSTRDATRGGVHSRVVENAEWAERRFDWAIARMLD